MIGTTSSGTLIAALIPVVGRPVFDVDAGELTQSIHGALT